jgi:hypothetical protein
MIGQTGFVAGLLWLGYLAIEPYVRKHWPDSLISWTRLRAGRPRDPLVASHVLIGFAMLLAGCAYCLDECSRVRALAADRRFLAEQYGTFCGFSSERNR